MQGVYISFMLFLRDKLVIFLGGGWFPHKQIWNIFIPTQSIFFPKYFENSIDPPPENHKKVLKNECLSLDCEWDVTMG